MCKGISIIAISLRTAIFLFFVSYLSTYTNIFLNQIQQTITVNFIQLFIQHDFFNTSIYVLQIFWSLIGLTESFFYLLSKFYKGFHIEKIVITSKIISIFVKVQVITTFLSALEKRKKKQEIEFEARSQEIITLETDDEIVLFTTYMYHDSITYEDDTLFMSISTS